MWQSSTITQNSTLANGSINSALQSAMSALDMPNNVAVKNGTQANAASDERRDLLANSDVDVIAITPWSTGEHSRDKNSMSFYLSPFDARAELAKRLSVSNWQSAFVIAVMADGEHALAIALHDVLQAFPCVQIQTAKNHAEKMAAHDSSKRFLNNSVPTGSNTKLRALDVFALAQTAAQNISISEAIASDENPVAMLADFIARRETRLSDIRTKVSELTSLGGRLEFTLKLTGGDLSEKLLQPELPKQQSSMCVLIAFGGSQSAMQPIFEVAGL